MQFGRRFLASVAGYVAAEFGALLVAASVHIFYETPTVSSYPFGQTALYAVGLGLWLFVVVATVFSAVGTVLFAFASVAARARVPRSASQLLLGAFSGVATGQILDRLGLHQTGYAIESSWSVAIAAVAAALLFARAPRRKIGN